MTLEFSFDHRSYRKNLADSLRQKRAINPDEAKELLLKEHKTLRYKVSEDIKKVKAKIEARKKVLPKAEVEKPAELSVETFRIEGSDGIEHELELHTLDISAQIPDEYKLLCDVYRLQVLRYELHHLGIIPDADTSFLEKPEAKEFVRKGFIDSADLGFFFKRYLKDGFTKEDTSLLSEFDYKQFDKLISEEVLKRLDSEQTFLDMEGFWMGKIEWFRFKILEPMQRVIFDRITDGLFSNKKSFSHVVSYYGRNKGDGYTPDPKKELDLMSRYPHEHLAHVIHEEVVDIRTAKSKWLWINAGGVLHGTGSELTKLIIIWNSESQRFLSEVSDLSGGSVYWRLNQKPESFTLKEKMDIAVEHGNARIDFKKDAPWLLFADWIVDLYHGRAYSIKEVGKRIPE